MAVSHASSIQRRHLQLRKFDAVDAAHIQRHHIAAIGLLTARKDVDAAIDAELVVDRVLVEEVFLQILLAGAELKVARTPADSLPEGTFFHYDLIGCDVVDARGGTIGTVTAVEGTMEMSRLVVAGARGEVLIPLVAAICTEIDVARRRIVADPPEGLLAVNERGAP